MIKMSFIDERKFQLEMLKLQIEHQHHASVYMGLMVLVFSVAVSVLVSYVGFAIAHNNIIWALSGLGMFVVLSVLTYYLGMRYKRGRESIDSEIQKLSNKYAW